MVSQRQRVPNQPSGQGAVAASQVAYQDLPPDAGGAKLPARREEPPPASAAPPAEAIGPNGYSGPSIADPVAHDLVDTILFGHDDPALKHEMVWAREVVRAAARVVTFHANNGPHDPPQLAPMDAVMNLRDAVEHIVQPRLAAIPTKPSGSASTSPDADPAQPPQG